MFTFFRYPVYIYVYHFNLVTILPLKCLSSLIWRISIPTQINPRAKNNQPHLEPMKSLMFVFYIC